MQTFLPYSNFVLSAQSLDRQRLGKQRVENLQIMKTLLVGGGYIHHPIMRMWRGYERALLTYQEVICWEWMRRGYKDSCLLQTYNLYWSHFSPADFRSTRYINPSWMGDEDFHRSHQSNLIQKDPLFYGSQFPGVPDDLEYIWPGGTA